jgi:hypothetical protein
MYCSKSWGHDRDLHLTLRCIDPSFGFDQTMVLNSILLSMMRPCNMYVTAESISRKNIGSKGNEHRENLPPPPPLSPLAQHAYSPRCLRVHYSVQSPWMRPAAGGRGAWAPWPRTGWTRMRGGLCARRALFGGWPVNCVPMEMGPAPEQVPACHPPSPQWLVLVLPWPPCE